jgi:branched-subunit amino acid transport protein
VSPMLQIVLAGVGTYLFRLSAIALAGGRAAIPPRVETALGMIPPAVLAAIAAESLLYDGDAWRGLDEWHVTIVVAAAIAWRTKSLALCLGLGMPLLWGLAALG